MATLTGEHLQSVVRLFRARGVFYHACQLKDFSTYVRLGGIPSRNLLETSGLPYTCFDTDAIDHQNGVWPKVFGNLSDFGQGFAMGQWSEGKAPTPNPYGPILLVAHPEILLDAADAAICLRSAGVQGFAREFESLSSINQVDRIFIHPATSPHLPDRTYIKHSSQLRKEFSEIYDAIGKDPPTYNPEISCTVPNERLPLTRLSHVIVDRYYKSNRSLISRVADIAFPGGLQVEIKERRYRNGRSDILDDLSRVLTEAIVGAADLRVCADVNAHTRDWAARILTEGLEWQYLRFARYLREGTLTI